MQLSMADLVLPRLKEFDQFFVVVDTSQDSLEDLHLYHSVSTHAISTNPPNLLVIRI